MNRYWIKNGNDEYWCERKDLNNDKFYGYWSRFDYSLNSRVKYIWVNAQLMRFAIHLMSKIKTTLERVDVE